MSDKKNTAADTSSKVMTSYDKKMQRRKEQEAEEAKQNAIVMEMEEKEGMIVMHVVVQAQNPGLNPSLLVKAIETHRADLAPDFARVHRNEVMDAEMKKFR